MRADIENDGLAVGEVPFTLGKLPAGLSAKTARMSVTDNGILTTNTSFGLYVEDISSTCLSALYCPGIKSVREETRTDLRGHGNNRV